MQTDAHAPGSVAGRAHRKQRASVMPSLGRPPTMTPLYKTRPCTFYPMGKCLAGPLCSFAHGEADMRPSPDFERTSICPTLLARGSCRKAGCRYAHRSDELNSSPVLLKTKMCGFFFSQTGCVVGEACRFAHSANELQEAASVEATAMRQAGSAKPFAFGEDRTASGMSMPKGMPAAMSARERRRLEFVTNGRLPRRARARPRTSPKQVAFEIPDTQDLAEPALLQGAPEAKMPVSEDSRAPSPGAVPLSGKFNIRVKDQDDAHKPETHYVGTEPEPQPMCFDDDDEIFFSTHPALRQDADDALEPASDEKKEDIEPNRTRVHNALVFGMYETNKIELLLASDAVMEIKKGVADSEEVPFSLKRTRGKTKVLLDTAACMDSHAWDAEMLENDAPLLATLPKTATKKVARKHAATVSAEAPTAVEDAADFHCELWGGNCSTCPHRDRCNFACCSMCQDSTGGHKSAAPCAACSCKMRVVFQNSFLAVLGEESVQQGTARRRCRSL